ncbi:unnamed protein product [Blepharisma stoltei]|uniref:Uncharacterized protein n=1 Tax=Blepharisma stoltei TaxID=1481888 RepID=A0AAU9IMU0_9CILI|nr:unnamed protein product [Blepharisma stoltei]
MSGLTVIDEDIEEYTGEDDTETIKRLKIELKEVKSRAENAEGEISRLKNLENRVKELSAICQSKNTEIFAFERKIKELQIQIEVKDQQLVSMISLNSEFKALVENKNKCEQTDFEDPLVSQLQAKIAEVNTENERLKDLLVAEIEENQHFKNLIETSSNGHHSSYSSSQGTPTKRQSNSESPNAQIRQRRQDSIYANKNAKQGGYIPSTLRRPKEGFFNNM